MNSESISKVQLSSISSASDLIDAKLEQHQLCGSKHCPGCGHKLIDGSSKPVWVGLPAGVKFDPTDQELIEHLEAKVEDKASKAHPLIDEFIPTIQGEDGICYTHPEKLPGVTRDGLSRHFFHRPSKAYTTGTRKRRKIQTECDIQGTGETRWHKTGKTRPVMVNGKQKGCKKILVLYTNFGKNRKPEKTNWVMHQYHLGLDEEERDGELVVSKIFYQTQPRQSSYWANDRSGNNGEGSGRRESIGSGSTSMVSSDLTAIDMHHLKASEQQHFSFVPFRRGFDDAGSIGDAAPTLRDANSMSASRDDHDHHKHHDDHHVLLTNTQDHEQHRTHHGMETTTFHISRSSSSQPISQQAIPSPSVLHHASIILDDQDSFHISRIMFQNESYLQQQTEEEQHQHQHHDDDDDENLGVRSASGLEEIIMGCTSSNNSSASAIKEESSITNTQDTVDWIKYSSFWHDPDNPDHHHG